MMKKIRFKFWVEADTEKFYGPGPNELLKRIRSEGSLSRAAEQMHMSYKKAWDIIHRLNEYSEEPFVIMKKGGQHGGGAEVTPHAIKVIEHYEQLEHKVNEYLDQQKDFVRLLK